MAKTYTSTKTYTRILFLQKQIIEILRTTTQVSDDMLSKLLQAVEKQWIHEINIYALDYNNLCRAKLNMTIDWSEYQRQISIGKITIAVDSRWKNDLLPETDSTIWAFNEYVRRYSLRTEWRISYTDWIGNNASKLAEARRFLGTSPGKSIKWVGKTIGDYGKNKDFPEFGIGLYFTE